MENKTLQDEKNCGHLEMICFSDTFPWITFGSKISKGIYQRLLDP